MQERPLSAHSQPWILTSTNDERVAFSVYMLLYSFFFLFDYESYIEKEKHVIIHTSVRYYVIYHMV